LIQEKHFNIPKIAKEMNRTIPSVKNYYYRKYSQPDLFSIAFENCEDQNNNDFQTFQDNLSIFGIKLEELLSE
jgi:hypothetical protein